MSSDSFEVKTRDVSLLEGLGRYLHAPITGKKGIDNEYRINDTASFGRALRWLAVNRNPNTSVSISKRGCGRREVNFYAIRSKDRDRSGRWNNARSEWNDPASVVEVTHLHAHFDRETEKRAIEVLRRLKRVVESKEQDTVPHHYVWHEKNGPHDKWSWEMWVETPEALGIAVSYLMEQPRGDLYFMFHVDTDQEYTDHAMRMAFVGDRDDLDLDFFQPPLESYAGPQSRARVTNESHIFSMGKMWDRRKELNDKDDGSSSYGAMDREDEETDVSQKEEEDSMDERELLLKHARDVMTARSISNESDTPPPLAIFVDLKKLRRHLDELKSAFPSRTLHAVALKASPMRGIVAEIASAGMGLEAASFTEMKIALDRVPSSQIVFDSPCKTDEELRFALTQHEMIVNLDSLQEVERVACMVKDGLKVAAYVGLRVNPCVGAGSIALTSTALTGSKFGVCLETHGKEKIASVFEQHNSWLTGLHCHVGSGGCGVDLLVRGVKRTCDVAAAVRQRHCRIRHVDIGGGIPLDLKHPERAPTFATYARELRKHVPELFDESLGHIIVTEFGRRVHSCTAHAISRVSATKRSGGRHVAITHVGADLLLRTAYMPGHWCHRLWVVDGSSFHVKPDDSGTDVWDVAGPLCFSGDYVARARPLPKISPGDLIVVRDVGAYTLSMWSRYNSRCSPGVWGYDGDILRCLRRKETEGDVIRFWG